MNKETKIQLAGIESESIVDGPGIRLTVFTQGCPHHCKGCHNPESWDFNGGYEDTVENIIKMVDKNPLLQGLTFSGGEPFSQAESLVKLGKQARKRNLDIIIYTGYTYEDIINGFSNNPYWEPLLNLTDYLIDGPFILSEKSLSLRFRGSKNQRIINVKKSLEKDTVVLADI